MDKAVLRKWLDAGYVENGITYPSHKGTPQGGIISPTLSNMVLDGMEQVARSVVPRRNRINFVRYADDFIVTGKSKTILETKVKPAIETFLSDRGLELSEEKTVISHIKDAFTFLGQTFRRHGSTLHITPSKEGVLALVRKIGDLIRQHRSSPMEGLIKKLNQMLRGWANYHRHVVSSEIFSRVDNYVYEQLWRMLQTETSDEVQELAFQEILVSQRTEARVLRNPEIQGEETSSQGSSDMLHRDQKTYQNQGRRKSLYAGIRRLLLAQTEQ